MSKFKIQSSKLIATSGAIVALLISASPVFAHVVVKPDTAGVAAFQTFTMVVSNEKDISVTGLRLVIPEGLLNVSPNVKPGWQVTMKDDDEGKVIEISWTGGAIPLGLRDEFMFSAQAPALESTLMWKAYQTYSDGTVVSWDEDPAALRSMTDEEKGAAEEEGRGPFSTTKVINDLASPVTTSASSASATSGSMATVLSVVAIVLSLAALGMQMNKKRK